MNTPESLRHLLRLAESAHAARDDDVLSAVAAAIEVLVRCDSSIDMEPVSAYIRSLTDCYEYCRMPHDIEQSAILRRRVVQELAKHNESFIVANDQKALALPPMVRLITAMYIRQVDGATEGVSIALTIDDHDVVQFPRQGPLIDELRVYSDKHQPPRGDIRLWMPSQLAEYRLMAGSVEVQQVLPEELTTMNF